MSIVSTIHTLVPVVLIASFLAGATDMNNDGKINTEDSQLFLKLTNEGTLSGQSYDMNGDDTVDLSDALLYGQWVNGLYHSASHPSLYLNNPSDSAALKQYQEDLSALKGVWDEADLRDAYPDNSTNDALNYGEEIAFLDRISSALGSGFANNVAEKGVAVFTGSQFPNFYSALDEIHSADLPLIFTTDAMLQTIYRSYDNILMSLEEQRFITMLNNILFSSLIYNYRAYGNEDYAVLVRDYLLTALHLLDPSRSDIQLTDEALRYISLVESEEMGKYDIYGRPKLTDFSQFKPRGHYTETPRLSNYFRAMMWLSRADLSFEIFGADTAGAEAKAAANTMKAASLCLWDCVVASGTYSQWLHFNRVIEFMVGMSDGGTIRDMGSLAHSLDIENVPEFLTDFNAAAFDSALVDLPLGVQMILSEGKTYLPGEHDSLSLSRTMSFMPQRFILDSYTFSQLVFPLVEKRYLPSSLDIAFTLGDNSALTDHRDLHHSAVPGILGAQRKLYDGISKTGWQSNLYTSWLYFLRTLNGAENNTAVSPVFRTLAWRKKMRNTQLMSWAHLRHNTILYAKQSYTGIPICEHPRAYVEPYPDFFHAVRTYANMGRDFFESSEPGIAQYFGRVAEISGKLWEAAERTAAGLPPTPAQEEWIKQVLVPKQTNGCVPLKVLDGWYFDLIYEKDGSSRPSSGETEQFTTIADVHTKPASPLTGPHKVLHAATGLVNIMAVVVELNDCNMVFAGPVGSFYDVITSDSSAPERLNDEEWEKAISENQDIVKRPDWIQSLLP